MIFGPEVPCFVHNKLRFTAWRRYKSGTLWAGEGRFKIPVSSLLKGFMYPFAWYFVWKKNEVAVPLIVQR